MRIFSPGWFVVYTKPRHERRVTCALQKAGIDNFLPLTRKLRIWSDRKKYVEEPLFPSYVFIKLEDLQGYFTSLDIDSILYFVRTGNQIAKVNEVIITNLKILIAKAADNIEVTSDRIPAGSKLTIKEGVFTGFCCEVVEYKGKEIFAVRIELLQRNILIDVPAEQLMSVTNVY
ncbi:MAG TPA: UpxY family transcription antiterminator [Cyclobacteriaceae bacterium]|jgi:transcription antitermination factor NusG|nr:UpxY family transcription antiterminator [Cyclobacteriaceae bacterium]